MSSQLANHVEKKIRTTDGSGQIGYEVNGSGEKTILCLPSLGDTRRQYEKFIPGLVQAGYRVLATDLRGIGQSEGNFASYELEALVTDIKAILDNENIEKVYLAGCSVSGASAGLFALKYPERVEGLILFSPLMRNGSKFVVWLMTTLLQTPLIGRLVWTTYFKTLYPDSSRPLNPEYLAAVAADAKRPYAMKATAKLSASIRLDERIAQIKSPALIYLGTKDPDFKDVRAEAAKLAQELPQAQIEVMEGVGHYPQREVAESVLVSTLNWLKKH